MAEYEIVISLTKDGDPVIVNFPGSKEPSKRTYVAQRNLEKIYKKIVKYTDELFGGL